MKALAGRGGGFFMGGKRMRGFGLGPGMEDARFGFYDGGMPGPEFGYPGRFPGDFFPGSGGAGPPPIISFNPAGETGVNILTDLPAQKYCVFNEAC